MHKLPPVFPPQAAQRATIPVYWQASLKVAFGDNGRPDMHPNELGGGRFAVLGVAPPGDQCVALGIVARTTSLRNVVGYQPQAEPLDVGMVHEQNIARPRHLPITVFVAVDGRFELIIAAQRDAVEMFPTGLLRTMLEEIRRGRKFALP